MRVNANQLVCLLIESENTVTLADLYPDGIDQYEALADVVRSDDFDVPLPIRWLSWAQLRALKTRAGDLTAMQAFDKFADVSQRRLVRHYAKQIRKGMLVNPIVIDGDSVLDGQHRLAAACMLKKGLPAVDVNDLPA